MMNIMYRAIRSITLSTNLITYSVLSLLLLCIAVSLIWALMFILVLLYRSILKLLFRTANPLSVKLWSLAPSMWLILHFLRSVLFTYWLLYFVFVSSIYLRGNL